MKKYSLILTCAAAASSLVATTFAQESPNQARDYVPTGLTNAGPASSQCSIEKGSKIIGMEVRNYQNEKLGKVDELAVDLQSGRIVQVVLSIGGFLGVGDTLTAVPPGALHYDPVKKVVHLDADKEKLKAAPKFESVQWEEYCQSNHLAEIYSYYGQPPYSPTMAGAGKPLSSGRARDAYQTLTAGDQGSSAADVDTSKRIRKEIVAAKDMSLNARNVKIITENGRVTLRGPVNTEQEKQSIGEIATRIAQPQNVDNQLEVKLAPTGRN